MKFNQIAKTLIFVGAVVLTACGVETLPTPTSSPTAEEVSQLSETESVATEAPTPGPTFTPSPSPEPTTTNTLVPTVTATPTFSPTPGPVAKIVETLTGLINVRAGPGTDYPTLTQLEAANQEFLVTGRNEDSSWWQISLADIESSDSTGWIFGELVILSGSDEGIPIAEIPPLPTATPEAVAAVEAEAEAEVEGETVNSNSDNDQPPSAEELADQLRCGKDFCVTYQAMVPIWENGGCVGNHSIYITVLEGPPPGRPMDGVVIGDTFNNVEVGSGSHGPGRTEITLWSNSMTLIAKRHMDGTPYTSEESFNFTSHDELIPAEVLAASGYCDGNVESCRQKQQVNQICRGHYSWRVTFHKFD